MKTTLEIPDELMQRVKMRAVQRQQKLKDVVAHLLELGFAASASSSNRTRRLPKPVQLKGGAKLDIASVEAMIGAERD